jgi:DNA glycosylase AlkZ-like
VRVRTLTLRDLNRATLARQLLLERRRLSALAAIERLVGMQAQWPPAPYVGLWSRLQVFRRATLERAVLRGDVLKPTVMRGTLHLVTARDYPTFWAAFREMATWFAPEHLEHAVRVVPEVRELARSGPLTQKAALEHLEREHGHTDVYGRRVFQAVRRHAHLLHAPETALWTTRPQAVYHLYDEPESLDALAARAEIVRRYLAAFGPATRADLANWSGLRVADFLPALEALEPLRRCRDENRRELLDLPRAPLPSPDTPAPVRFLPKWDNVLLAFADRRRVISDEHRREVVGKNGDVAPTFLVDGFVAGVWRVESGRVRVEPFSPLPRVWRREVADEAARLEAWLR